MFFAPCLPSLSKRERTHGANSYYINPRLVEIQAFLDSSDLLLSCLGATVVATSALEGWILHLDIELDLRLST